MNKEEFVSSLSSMISNSSEVSIKGIKKVDLWLFAYNSEKKFTEMGVSIPLKIIYEQMLEYCHNDIFHTNDSKQVIEEIYSKWVRK